MPVRTCQICQSKFHYSRVRSFSFSPHLVQGSLKTDFKGGHSLSSSWPHIIDWDKVLHALMVIYGNKIRVKSCPPPVRPLPRAGVDVGMPTSRTGCHKVRGDRRLQACWGRAVHFVPDCPTPSRIATKVIHHWRCLVMTVAVTFRSFQLLRFL